MFEIKKIFKKAKKLKKTIVFPEAAFSDRTIEAVKYLRKKKLCNVILIGDESAFVIKDKSLVKFTIINPKTSPLKDRLVKVLFEKRKEKGLTKEQAEELVLDPYYFATLLVENGSADGMIAGAECPTATTLRPALQIIGPKKKGDIVSSCMLMFGKNKAMGEKTFLLSDCGVCPNPNSKELATIAEQSVETYKLLGLDDPKLAFLSYSSKGSAKGEEVSKVSEAVGLFKGKNLKFDGEIQFDAAVNKEVAKIKIPDSPIQGDANILIFPDLNAGNINYKTMQYVGGLKAIGPILQGLKKPVNDLSRGCSVEDIIILTVITCLQAIKKGEKE